MAASGYTPIILFNSGVTGHVPTTANLAVGELAINYTDGKLYYNNGTAIATIANAASAGISTSSPNTWTAAQTFNNSNILLLGSSTGSTTFTSANASATNYTVTFPANTGTVAELNLAQTWTGTQTFNGTSSTFAVSLLDANETVNVVGSAPAATTNFYVQSGGVQYYTSNAANNWTLNIAFSSGTSLNTALSTNQAVTFTLITTQGTTAYYANAITIDGTSVTPKWIGGAPTAGNASGLDVYRFSVVKTASATYTVLASLTQYK